MLLRQTMTEGRTMSEQPVEKSLEQLRSISSTPTLSDEGRQLIEGKLGRERYIENSRHRAERAALIEVNAQSSPLGAIPAVVASLVVGGAVAAALVAQQRGAGWALVVICGVVGCAAPLLALLVRAENGQRSGKARFRLRRLM